MRRPNAALSAAIEAKNATDRASQLDRLIAVEREKLTKLEARKEVDPHGTALAKLIRLPESEAGFLASAQQLGVAFGVELIIIACLIAWEALPREPRRAPEIAEAVVVEEPAKVSPRAAPEVIVETIPAKLPAPPRPKLVAARKEPPAGPIARIMTEALDRAKGQRVEMADAFVRYAEVCRAEGRPAVTPDQFLEAMVTFCRLTKIKTRMIDGRPYLIDVALADAGGSWRTSDA